MPTIGVSVSVTLSTDKTRSNLTDFYRGLAAEGINYLPYSFLENQGEKSYPLKDASFIIFIGDVYDGSSPFDLTLVTNGTHKVPVEAEETTANDDSGEQFVSGAMSNIASGKSAYPPSSQDDEDDDDEDLYDKPQSIPSMSLTPATPSATERPSIPLVPATSNTREQTLHNIDFLMLNAANLDEIIVKSLANGKVGYKLLIG